MSVAYGPSPPGDQTGDPSGKSAGRRGSYRRARELVERAKVTAPGDWVHTHTFTGRQWVAKTTLTIRLRDPGLLALRLCMDESIGVCLCGETVPSCRSREARLTARAMVPFCFLLRLPSGARWRGTALPGPVVPRPCRARPAQRGFRRHRRRRRRRGAVPVLRQGDQAVSAHAQVGVLASRWRGASPARAVLTAAARAGPPNTDST